MYGDKWYLTMYKIPNHYVVHLKVICCSVLKKKKKDMWGQGRVGGRQLYN